MGATFTRDYASADEETDDVNSFIISASVSPLENLMAGLAYASEPGYDSRNNTINLFAEYIFNDMTFDAEYFAATKRETIGGQTFKEIAYTLGVAYQISDPLEVAARYEVFDNDRPASDDGTYPYAGDLDYNIALGANYDLMENIYLMFELRCLNELNDGDATYEEMAHEVNLLLGAGF
jgi:predicted porin